MIIGELKDLEKYASTNKNFPEAMAFLRKCLADNVPDGKYYPEAGDYYISISSKELKPKDGIKAEVHRDYTDIQVILDGDEVMYVPQTVVPEIAEAYDPARDVAFCTSVPAESCVKLLMKKDTFAIFFAGELHAPDHPVTEGKIRRKALVKVKQN